MIIRFSLAFLALAYMIGSGMRIHQLDKALTVEKNRVYALADGLEVLLSASENSCLFKLGAIPASRLIHAEEIKRAEMLTGFPPDARLFVYSLRINDIKKAEYDRRYRSDSSLEHETSVITDKQGRILSIQWGIP